MYKTISLMNMNIKIRLSNDIKLIKPCLTCGKYSINVSYQLQRALKIKKENYLQKNEQTILTDNLQMKL